MSYEKTYVAFEAYHRQTLNVALHVITTPMCLLSLFALLAMFTSVEITFAVLAAYSLSLCFFLPVYLSFFNTLALGVIFYGAIHSSYVIDYLSLPSSSLSLVLLFIVSYLGQDFAHYITGEATFQSTYISDNGGFFTLLVHSYFLLPLVIDVSIRNNLFEKILNYYVLRSFVFHTTCKDAKVRQDAALVKQWLDEKQLPKDVTSHWWFHSLPTDIKSAFHRIVESDEIKSIFSSRYNPMTYNVEVVPGMNEVYVSTTSNNKINSDKVFYTNHVDGPFMWLPFVSVYRGVFVMSDNKLIRTIFPEVPTSHVLSTAEVCLFDFNREIHRIEQVDGVTQNNLRYSLKIHYVVYPKWLKYYGWFAAWATTKYDIVARFLFLSTLKPETLIQKALSRFILLCTHFTFGVVQYGGGASVLNYCAFIWLLSYLIPVDFPIFVYGTSFVHYAIYISTYYHRGHDVAFEKFKHVVMAFKFIAVTHLALRYVWYFEFNALSIAMIAVGITLSTTAAAALGIDKTYFGWELGRVKNDSTFKVLSFPYNLGIPHPMIVGNLIWLLGLQVMPSFRQNVPHLAYIHCVLYVVHMLQEHFDIHNRKVKRFDHVEVEYTKKSN